MDKAVVTDRESQLTALQIVVSAMASAMKGNPQFMTMVAQMLENWPESESDPGGKKVRLSVSRLLG